MPSFPQWTASRRCVGCKRKVALVCVSVLIYTQTELFDIVAARSLTSLVYVGVHENMCIMGRPFAIEEVWSVRGPSSLK